MQANADRRNTRPGLDEATVIRAAADLVDAEGLETLNLAQLAAKLKVKTPSLYNHVSGLDGVRRGLAALGARALGERLMRAAVGKSGAEGVFALANAYRAYAKEHPGLYAASLRVPEPDNTDLIAADEEILGILRAVLAPYHLQGDALTHAARALRSLAHGFVSLELAGGFGMPTDLDASYRASIRMLLTSLEYGDWQPEHPAE
ncbi:MAG: WHG domain-containing protein [Ktedonobacterales bacterium]